ncbi:MAG: arylamine N-acetyltransferase [Bacteroidetes bacterium]|nr:arylamine N-acetyltransferase [Bacteroidota bacterium]
MDIANYLRRINYSGTVKCDLQSLSALQYQHLINIAFEDADIFYGRPIALDIASFYEKVVNHKRGGYCYELNGLFYQLLLSQGFDVSMISARVANGKSYGPEYDHMALLVKVSDKEWLVDVGFGDFSMMPLMIEPGMIQNDGRHYYRIQDKVMVDGRAYLSVEKWNSATKTFKTEYIFTTRPRALSSFAAMHTYHQSSPDSHFVRNFICSVPTANGRISIVNNKLIKTENGKKEPHLISSELQRFYLLQDLFGIELTKSTMATARLPNTFYNQ